MNTTSFSVQLTTRDHFLQHSVHNTRHAAVSGFGNAQYGWTAHVTVEQNGGSPIMYVSCICLLDLFDLNASSVAFLLHIICCVLVSCVVTSCL